MATPYTDGDFTTARTNGSRIVTVDQATRSYVYEYEYMQFAANWAKLAIDTAGPVGDGYLVEESETQDAGGGVLSWKRTFAEVPETRNDYVPYVHNAQYLSTTDGETSVAEIALPTTARVQYDYFHTSDPSSIAMLRAVKLITVGTLILILHGPDPGYDLERIAEDSTIERWRWPGCNIWERRTVYAYQPSPAELVA